MAARLKNEITIEVADSDGYLVCRRQSSNWWIPACQTAEELLAKHPNAVMARVSGRGTHKDIYKATADCAECGTRLLPTNPYDICMDGCSYGDYQTIADTGGGTAK